MRMKNWRQSLPAVALGTLMAATVAVAVESSPESGTKVHEPTVVFLVRHAEKARSREQGRGQDPDLTEAGRQRAKALARVLASAGITRIHSTDYRRTLDTARPLAEVLGLEVEIYDARAPRAFVSQLRESPGRHLVVGHSNTTPELVKLLGGEPGTPIDEGSEYDRLYVLVLGPHGSVATILQRYGAPSAP